LQELASIETGRQTEQTTMAQDEQWAWLGLLKWSLAYTDGTADSAPPRMSEEDKAFLQNVMKDGIINEQDRMKTILTEVTETMSKWRQELKVEDGDEHRVIELLQELRDCVEQIDFARSFAAMKGPDFLLGCVQEREHVPTTIRILCLGVLATMSGNNPPIQQQLLDMGALKTLSDIFFAETDDTNGKLRARTMQAIGAAVRSHELAEAVFTQLEQSPALLVAGLGMGSENYRSTPQVLRSRALFLLQALSTSDSAATLKLMKERFESAIVWVTEYVVDDKVEESPELRETALAMIQRILEQGTLASIVVNRKSAMVGMAVSRVAALRKLTGEEKEYAATELAQWEAILVLLSRADDSTAEPIESIDAAPKILNQ